MLQINDKDFSKLIAEVMDELPEEYIKGLKNVLITYEDQPTPEQLRKQNIGEGQTLLGLYEGIPLTKRNAGYQFVLPDKITLFKLPLLAGATDFDILRRQVKHTLWHEVAHYYGLDHERIHEIERNWQ